MADLRFGVLGPLDVTRRGAPVVVGGSKLRVLLASLLLEANTTVSTDRLAERLWGERLPASARKSVQLLVLRLRRVLDDDLIETCPTGYRLRVRPECVDLLRFRDLTEAARTAGRTGAGERELALLIEALACWRGPALADVPSASLQREEAARLGEDRLRARERVVRLSLDLGHHREIIGELTELTREQPWQETFWAYLIHALHRSGRRADALDTYRDVYRKFTDELGVEPGAEIQRVHRLALADTADTAAENTVPTTICQVPADVHRFVGRADPVASLLTLPDEPHRPWTVVISGPPGVGKTAFAVHVARRIGSRFPDGQLHVDLRGFAVDPPVDPAAALTRFLTALGIRPDPLPGDVEARAALFRSAVAGKRMLLLLDNAIDVEQVRPLLPGQPGCVVLITSRNDLRGLAVHPGAQHVPLDVLTGAESAAVLTDLLGADRAAAEPEALAGLARACAHLPLALRIAGANLAADPHRDIGEYTAAMTTPGRLTELTIDGDEHSAVRMAFDLSYRRLSEDDRRLFRLLGPVPGPDIGVPAAAALTGAAHADVRRALDRLVAANLVHRPRHGRYQLHDLIREYAAECAATDASAEDAVVTLVDFFIDTATGAARLLYQHPGPPSAPGDRHLPLATEATALQWLDQERPNLVAAIRWAAVRPSVCGRAWRLADALWGYLASRGAAGEAVTACTAALDAARERGDRPAEVSLRALLGTIEYNLNRYDPAIDHYLAGLRAARDLGDTRAEGDALCNTGRAYWRKGRPAEALRYYGKALAVSRAAGHREVEIAALNLSGTVHLFSGRPRTAIDWYERALTLARAAGDREAVHRAVHGRGNARQALGMLDDAIADHTLVLTYCRASGRGFGETASLLNLAEIEVDAGRPRPAMAHADEALRRGREIGDVRAQARAHEYTAAAWNLLGDHSRAITLGHEGLRLAGSVHAQFAMASVALVLAAAYRGNGDPVPALHYAEVGLRTARDSGHLLVEAAALSEVAHAHLDLGDVDLARDHARTALRLARERGQALVEPGARRVLAALRIHATSMRTGGFTAV